MLFLNLHYFKESYYAIPPEKVSGLSAASWSFMEKYIKSGKCKERYWFANGSGGIAIWDFESAIEASSILRESPVFPYIDSELIPLIDYQDATKLRKQSETTQKAAKK
jgi:muconolactone D-isomerase